MSEVRPDSGDVLEVGVVVHHRGAVGNRVGGDLGVGRADGPEQAALPEAVLDIKYQVRAGMLLAVRELGECRTDAIVVVSVAR